MLRRGKEGYLFTCWKCHTKHEIKVQCLRERDVGHCGAMFRTESGWPSCQGEVVCAAKHGHRWGCCWPAGRSGVSFIRLCDQCLVWSIQTLDEALAGPAPASALTLGRKDCKQGALDALV